jgi:hypothetical protein
LRMAQISSLITRTDSGPKAARRRETQTTLGR